MIPESEARTKPSTEVHKLLRVCAAEERSTGISLLVLKGAEPGRRWDLPEGCTLIGRSEAADIHLAEPTVSRRHCRIHRSGTQVRIEHVGEKNLSLVNGIPVRSAWLLDGYHLQLGRVTLRVLRERPMEPSGSYDFRLNKLVGASRRVESIRRRIGRFAPRRHTVLVRGETGTGKSLIATLIHQISPRNGRRMVTANCANLNNPLLQSTLFGHKKGAFTGADRDRDGLFAQANKSTLFFDEVGELDLPAQAELLRVLDTGIIRPVGSDREEKVDVRVVAATNRELEKMVEEGSFREDLYYRLSVLPIDVPPLRERMEDLEQIVGELLDRELDLSAAERARLTSPSHFEAMRRHRWPGNIRELSNHLTQALVSDDLRLRAVRLGAPGASSSEEQRRSPSLRSSEEVSAMLDQGVGFREAEQQVRRAFARAYLMAAIERCNGLREILELTGLGRSSYYAKLEKYGIKLGSES